MNAAIIMFFIFQGSSPTTDVAVDFRKD